MLAIPSTKHSVHTLYKRDTAFLREEITSHRGGMLFPSVSVHDLNPNRISMQLAAPQQMTLRVFECKSRWQKQSTKMPVCRQTAQTCRTWREATALHWLRVHLTL